MWVVFVVLLVVFRGVVFLLFFLVVVVAGLVAISTFSPCRFAALQNNGVCERERARERETLIARLRRDPNR